MKSWKNESGQILVITALSMMVLLGFVAFATDVGLMLRQRRMAQTAADSAALAATTEMLYESNPTNVTAGVWDAAAHDATLNGFAPGASNGAANPSSKVTLFVNVSPNISVPGFNFPSYAQATVSLRTQTVFMNLFGIHSMNVGATAIASNSITSGGCIYIQNPPDAGGTTGPANPALDMGGNSLIASKDCAVTVNGDIALGGNSKINARYVSATGTITGKNVGNGWAPGSTAQDDPLAKLQSPANQPQPSGSTGCTAPGGMLCVYDYNCDATSCTLSNVTLTGNTVYYYDKPVVVSGDVTGGAGGNTIYLATETAYLNFNHVGKLTLTPPPPPASDTCSDSTNPFCGIVIDAPIAGKDGAGTYTCSAGNGNNGENPGEIYFDFGSSKTTLTGVVYAPYMQLFVQDQGAQTTLNADLVLGNLCAQSGTLTVNGFSGPGSPLTKVGLVY